MGTEDLKHDLNDTEWWRSYFERYGMDPDEIIPEQSEVQKEQERGHGGGGRRKGWTPFAFFGVSIKL